MIVGRNISSFLINAHVNIKCFTGIIACITQTFLYDPTINTEITIKVTNFFGLRLAIQLCNKMIELFFGFSLNQQKGNVLPKQLFTLPSHYDRVAKFV